MGSVERMKGSAVRAGSDPIARRHVPYARYQTLGETRIIERMWNGPIQNGRIQTVAVNPAEPSYREQMIERDRVWEVIDHSDDFTPRWRVVAEEAPPAREYCEHVRLIPLERAERAEAALRSIETEASGSTAEDAFELNGRLLRILATVRGLNL